jgi:hypothetical protein
MDDQMVFEMGLQAYTRLRPIVLGGLTRRRMR